MLRSILVPLDGSGGAEHALAPAAALARRWGARLHLCHVRPGRPSGDGAYHVPGTPGARQRDPYLELVAKRVTSLWGVQSRIGVRAGPPARGILREAELVRADLVVLSTHGLGDGNDRWIGRTASEVVARADRPVLLLPPYRGPVEPDKLADFRRVLVVAEERLDTMRAVLGAVPLLTDDDPVYVLAAVAPGTGATEPAQAFLLRAAQELAYHGHVSERIVVSHLAPAPAILWAARERQADLITFQVEPGAPETQLVSEEVRRLLLRGATVPLLVQRQPVRAERRPSPRAAPRRQPGPDG